MLAWEMNIERAKVRRFLNWNLTKNPEITIDIEIDRTKFRDYFIRRKKIIGNYEVIKRLTLSGGQMS